MSFSAFYLLKKGFNYAQLTEFIHPSKNSAMSVQIKMQTRTLGFWKNLLSICQIKSVSVQNYWFKNIKNKLKQSRVNLVYRAPPLASEGVSTSETKFKAINSSSWSSGTSLKASIETAVPCPSLFRPIFLGIKDRPSFRSRSEEVARLHFLKSGK